MIGEMESSQECQGMTDLPEPAILIKRKVVPGYLYISLLFLLVCINALGAKFAVFSFELAPGVSSVYIIVAVMIVFGLWFGMYGAIAAYFGCFIGAGMLSGIPPDVNIYWSLADFWEVLIPLVAFRVLGCDPGLKSWRDAGVLLGFGIILNNVAGATWGAFSLALGGEIPWSEVVQVWYGWLTVNLIVCIILVPLMLFFLTPFLRDHELYVRRYWH
jgi:integral membrane sensor domain MASE1